MRGDGHEGVLAHAVASATDPLEVAVVLESAGVNDRVAAAEFGVPDVFALAELSFAGAAGSPDRPLSEPVVAPADRPPPGPGDRWTFHLRGILYAIPAAVALSLLPAGDPVASGLVLGGLVTAWAAGYGVTSIGWAHLGNLDAPGARRFLRRALVVGTVTAAAVAVLAVFGALILTSTVSVGLATILLLTGQAGYLLAAAALLLCGRELWLFAALLPAAAGAVLGLVGPATGPPGDDLAWPGASVVAAVVLALVATRRSARPRQPLPRSAWTAAGTQVCCGLFVALLVLFPAVDQLVDPGFDPLPLSVTAVALPLVLGMGVAESVVLRLRRSITRSLAATGSTRDFGRAARRATLRAHVAVAAALVVMSALVWLVVVGSGTPPDPRVLLLGVDYVVLGTALFAAMVLSVLGQGDRVATVLAGGVAALAAFLTQAGHPEIPSWVALAWHAVVGTVLLAVLGFGVRSHAGRPVSYR